MTKWVVAKTDLIEIEAKDRAQAEDLVSKGQGTKIRETRYTANLARYFKR